jgi:hypothetical protein
MKKPMQSPPADWPAPPTRPEAQLPDRSRGGRRGLLGLLAGLALLVALAQTPPGHSVMRLTGLAKAPAQYTSLYFTDPGGLPSALPAGHVGLDVSFAIHNATQSAGSYQWTVTLLHGSKTDLAASGTVALPAGGTTTESRPVSTLCRSGALEVTVRLAAPAESIHFKATCDG